MKLQNHTYPRRFAVLGAVFAAALFGSVLLGRFSVTPKELFRLLLSRLTETEQGWRDGAENVVFQIRLPRVAAAALIGAALAVAGVSYQGMFRNPMVSPDILGASTGAGFGAALAILLGAGYFGISASAFVFRRTSTPARGSMVEKYVPSVANTPFPGGRAAMLARPPSVEVASNSTTLCPRCAAVRAASHPAGPPPMTTTAFGASACVMG